MRAAIDNRDTVIVLAQVSKTLLPVRVPADYVFDAKLVIFALSALSQFGLLSSGIHQTWAIQHGTTMRVDPTYVPTRVFETFPRPAETRELKRIGQVLDKERHEIMLRRELGLTQLYNRVNDPHVADGDDADVARMRAIHTALDHIVMGAYGWGDVELNHGFHTYRQMTRWTVCPEARVEILDRLLEENHRRAALQGSAPAPAEDETTESEGSDD